jgi:hypothetical protein
MSSGFSYLDNQNRRFSQTVSVPAYVTATNSWMVTVHPVPSFCKIEKITLRASGDPSSSTVNLIVSNNGAAYKAVENDDDAAAPYIVGTGSATMGGNIAVFSFSGGLYYEDSFKTNCLYLFFVNNSFTAGDTFTVTVEGIQMSPYKVEHTDATPFLGDNSWRILRVDANSNVFDLTQKLTRNGNPYTIGNTLENTEGHLVFESTSDYLYIGSKRAWNKAMFYVPQYAQNTTAPTFQKLVGTSWVTMPAVQDNTSAFMGTTAYSSLSYSGVINVTAWTSVTPTNLSFDPLTSLQEDYEDFTQNIPRPGGFFYHPERYWLRMSFAGTTTADIKLAGIVPMR